MKPRGNYAAPMTDDQKHEILELAAAGVSCREIAERLGFESHRVATFVRVTKRAAEPVPERINGICPKCARRYFDANGSATWIDIALCDRCVGVVVNHPELRDQVARQSVNAKYSAKARARERYLKRRDPHLFQAP